jgi:hypothetical protein
MITNFESITYNLTPYECEMLPVVYHEIKGRDKSNPIKGAELCEKYDLLTEPRLRKIVNAIRSSGHLPVIATSCGYYMAKDQNEILMQIQSLQDRIDAIKQAQDGLRKFVNTHNPIQ